MSFDDIRYDMDIPVDIHGYPFPESEPEEDDYRGFHDDDEEYINEAAPRVLFQGWRKQASTLSTSGNKLPITGIPFSTSIPNHYNLDRLKSSQAIPGDIEQNTVPLIKHIPSLTDLCCEIIGASMPLEMIDTFHKPVPQHLQLRIASCAFPKNEDDIRLYSCLSHGSPEEFLLGENLSKSGKVTNVMQIGYHLSGTVAKNFIFNFPTRKESFKELATDLNRTVTVSVQFDRQKITVCHCSTCSKAWCSHVVALCLYRISHSKPTLSQKETASASVSPPGIPFELRAPLTDSLAKLDKEQLQKFALYLIGWLYPNSIVMAQNILDQLSGMGTLPSNPVQKITEGPGAPDPTAGASSCETTSWCLDEASLKAHIKKAIDKFVQFEPEVFELTDMHALADQPVISDDRKHLLNSLKLLKNPRAMWNLMGIVREMFSQRDSNAIMLLELTTQYIVDNDIIVDCWFNIHPNSPSGGNSASLRTSSSHKTSQGLGIKYAANALCEETLSLWKLAALNPCLTRDARLALYSQLTERDGALRDNITRKYMAAARTHLDSFPGFKPAIRACVMELPSVNDSVICAPLTWSPPFHFVHPVNDPSSFQQIFAWTEALFTHGRLSEALLLAEKLSHFLISTPEPLGYLVRHFGPTLPSASSQLTAVHSRFQKNSNSDASTKLQSSVPQPSSLQATIHTAPDLLKQICCLVHMLSHSVDLIPLAIDLGIMGLDMDRPRILSKFAEVGWDHWQSELRDSLRRCIVSAEENGGEICERMRETLYHSAERLQQGLFHCSIHPPVQLAILLVESLLPGDAKKPFQQYPPYEDPGVLERVLLAACLSTLSCGVAVSEAENQMLCECSRAQKGDLLLTLVMLYKEDSVILDQILNALFYPSFVGASCPNGGVNNMPSTVVKTKSGTGLFANLKDPSSDQIVEEPDVVIDVEATDSETAADLITTNRKTQRSESMPSGLESPEKESSSFSDRQQAMSSVEPRLSFDATTNGGDSSALDEDESDASINIRLKRLSFALPKRSSHSLAHVDSSAPETASSDNSPTPLRRNVMSSSHHTTSSSKPSSGANQSAGPVSPHLGASVGNGSSEPNPSNEDGQPASSSQMLRSESENSASERQNPLAMPPPTSPSMFNPFSSMAGSIRRQASAPAGVSPLMASNSDIASGQSVSSSSYQRCVRLEKSTRDSLPGVPNQPSKAHASFVFELSSRIYQKAGGSILASSVFNNLRARLHRILHFTSIKVALHSLWLSNQIEPWKNRRRFNQTVTFVTDQALDLGVDALRLLIHIWPDHLTPMEAASLADRASRQADREVVEAGVVLALETLQHADSLGENEAKRALTQCEEHSLESLEKACQAVQMCCRRSAQRAIHPDILFFVCKKYHELHCMASASSSSNNQPQVQRVNAAPRPQMPVVSMNPTQPQPPMTHMVSMPHPPSSFMRPPPVMHFINNWSPQSYDPAQMQQNFVRAHMPTMMQMPPQYIQQPFPPAGFPSLMPPNTAFVMPPQHFAQARPQMSYPPMQMIQQQQRPQLLDHQLQMMQPPPQFVPQTSSWGPPPPTSVPEPPQAVPQATLIVSPSPFLAAAVNVGHQALETLRQGMDRGGYNSSSPSTNLTVTPTGGGPKPSLVLKSPPFMEEIRNFFLVCTEAGHEAVAQCVALLMSEKFSALVLRDIHQELTTYVNTHTIAGDKSPALHALKTQTLGQLYNKTILCYRQTTYSLLNSNSAISSSHWQHTSVADDFVNFIADAKPFFSQSSETLSKFNEMLNMIKRTRVTKKEIFPKVMKRLQQPENFYKSTQFMYS